MEGQWIIEGLGIWILVLINVVFGNYSKPSRGSTRLGSHAVGVIVVEITLRHGLSDGAASFKGNLYCYVFGTLTVHASALRDCDKQR
jgi:hypothetical protein